MAPAPATFLDTVNLGPHRMTTDPTKLADAELRLILPGAAANVAIVRQATTGALGVLELGETRVLDINAAVSEACNNVVVHAYPGASGRMEVELSIGATDVEVTVTDHGVGITPNKPEPELGVQGLGLSLIQTLTDRVEFLGGVGAGTTVRMGFSLDGAGSSAADDEPRNGGGRVAAPPGEVTVAVSAGPLAAPVLRPDRRDARSPGRLLARGRQRGSARHRLDCRPCSGCLDRQQGPARDRRS